jgi:hypothetical protein
VIPSFKPIDAFQPREESFDTSINFLGVPSGFDESKTIFPL